MFVTKFAPPQSTGFEFPHVPSVHLLKEHIVKVSNTVHSANNKPPAPTTVAYVPLLVA
jgi:hypothetical protein